MFAALISIFGGCCLSVFTLEEIIVSSSGSGAFLTFLQFLLIAIVSVPTSSNVIPLRIWLNMVVLFLSSSVLTNYAFSFKVPMPLHIILKSSNISIGMVIGYLSGNQYTVRQIVGVFTVTSGIIITTFASHSGSHTTINSTDDLYFGVSILLFSVVLGSFLGVYQSHVYKTYGAHWKEGLFYTHALSIPFFSFMSTEIKTRFVEFSQSEDYAWPIRSLGFVKIPSLWMYAFQNVLTQYFCIAGVYSISSRVSSVTLNIILSIRKLISLVLSIWLFGNDFNLFHVLGCLLVFSGTLVYTSQPRTSEKVKIS